MDFKYENIRPMDVVCTASTSAFGRLIRLWTSHLKGRNGLVEMLRLQVTNHVGYIVELGDKYWLAEMLAGGLKISSLKEYLKNPEKERIVSIVRHSLFDNVKVRKEANSYVTQKAHDLVEYDYKGSPGSFVGLCGQGPKDWYCSEMVESVINEWGTSWDTWQLQSIDRFPRIAPIEIQFGRRGVQVQDFLHH
jgi:hypothetical protein